MTTPASMPPELLTSLRAAVAVYPSTEESSVSQPTYDRILAVIAARWPKVTPILASLRAALPPYFLVFDVESIGLHGEGFAVGWTVISSTGTEYEKGYLACPPENAKGSDESRKWCAENLPALVPNKEMPRGVRDGFWDVWQTWKGAGAVLVADCAWPVEARFLAQCVDDAPETREWHGPYPLHDVASVVLTTGGDPLKINERIDDELPVHHPMADAKQSARMLVAALQPHLQGQPTPPLPAPAPEALKEALRGYVTGGAKRPLDPWEQDQAAELEALFAPFLAAGKDGGDDPELTEDFHAVYKEMVARGDQIRETERLLRLILPMAKGHAAAHPVGNNAAFISVCEDHLSTRPAPAGEGVREEPEQVDILCERGSVFDKAGLFPANRIRCGPCDGTGKTKNPNREGLPFMPYPARCHYCRGSGVTPSPTAPDAAEDAGLSALLARLPENVCDLLLALNREFYSGPLAHADAFRILPRVAEVIRVARHLRAAPHADTELLNWLEAHAEELFIDRSPDANGGWFCIRETAKPSKDRPLGEYDCQSGADLRAAIIAARAATKGEGEKS